MHVKIIAEAGVNHNGDIALARKLVAVAAQAGADIVKFQTFKAENLVTKTAEKAQYQKDNCGAGESQYEMLKKLELDEKMHFELIDCCIEHNIEFLSTAFDSESLLFLTNQVGLKTLKLPSGEITNGPLIHDHARTGADLIVSTGMANLGEIEAALAVIAHGYCQPTKAITSIQDCFEIYSSIEGQNSLKGKVTILHCTSQYPAPDRSVNLKAMDTLHHAFGLPIGYSDHTAGIIASIAAVARGACVIEKHFTLDKMMEGPDHRASLEPKELTEMVSAIRSVTEMTGTSTKAPDESEISTRGVARKSLVALSTIKIDECFTPQNLGILRPGTGISPMDYWKHLGTASKNNYQAGETIK